MASSTSVTTAASNNGGRLKTILIGLLILILTCLFIGFLAAFIHERNKNNELSQGTTEAITATTSWTSLPSQSPSTPSTPIPPLPENLLLNKNVVPINYRLKIHSDPNDINFNGTVRIIFKIDENDLRKIIINCKDLNITSYTLTRFNLKNLIPIKNLINDHENERCIFELNDRLDKNTYELDIAYSNTFKNGQMIGYYRSQYQTKQNEQYYITSTKFEPTYARMAFPCFDEPSLKATFDITLIYPRNLNAISNQIETETIPYEYDDNFLQTTFEQTPRMSTYLVAFSINNFQSIETRTIDGTRVRIYSRSDQINNTKLALETAATILRYYDNITGLPYEQSSMKKLDLIAIPEFVTGALENWGLISFKESYLLFDNDNPNIDDRKKITSVIAHELSHMWIGNLVTTKWWNDLWLQEGFASYIEYYGQNYANPSIDIWNHFLLDDLYPSLKIDSLKNTHPLVPDSNKILTPNQVTSQFDTITYSKGASILAMIEAIIGRENFLKNFQNLLRNNQYSSIDTQKMIEYFTDDIEKVTGIDGKTFLNKWINHNGFPIITIDLNNKNEQQQRSKRSLPSKGELKLKQSIYYQLNSTDNGEPFNIYVTLVNSKQQQKSFLFNKSEMTLDLDSDFQIDDGDWFKLNPNGKNYYIVNYSSDNLDLLIDQLINDPTKFTIGDRINLLHDSYRSFDLSKVPFETLMKMLTYLKNEKDYLPWRMANDIINSFASKLSESGQTSLQYRNAIRSLIETPYDTNVDIVSSSSSTAIKSMKPNEILLQNQLISIACQFEYRKCLQQCSKLFNDWLTNGTPIDSNIKPLVLKYGLKNSENIENDWKKLWNLYENELDVHEKSMIMKALTSINDHNLLSTLISYSNDGNKINNENFFTVQQSIANNNDIGRNLLWEFIRNNWTKLISRFGLNDRRLGSYIRSILGGFQSPIRLGEIKEFFRSNPNAGAGHNARLETLEMIEKNIEWYDNNYENIAEFLNQRDVDENPWLNWRLSEKIRPKHYDIDLTVLVDEEIFDGTVRIKIDVLESTKYIILHAKDLTISKSSVYTKDNKLISVPFKPNVDNNNESDKLNNHFHYEPNQFWVIPFKNSIQPNQYMIELKFNGTLKNELSGLYLSKYFSTTRNETIKLATTQYEAIYARKTFPCFDEPSFKSTFTLTIRHSSTYKALSNMPIDFTVDDYAGDNNDDERNMKITKFKTTIKMSTYLIAIIVSDFESIESKSTKRNGRNYGVYTYNTEINFKNAKYALDIVENVVDYYEKKYFEFNYPLPKLDMISIPDFQMGAMENFGLITYRDIYLLYDQNKTSSISKTNICKIICHEIAHQWFGNVVTMKWWDELWLNEGFATFMEYKAVDAVQPSWHYQDFFSLNEIMRVYESDSILSTHPIQTKVTDENQIQSVFDSITYSKGSCVIRMLESMIGPEPFRLGIRNYIRKYQYSNTIASDLWNELSRIYNKNSKNDENYFDIEEMMHTWLYKDGFPIITIETFANNNTLKFTQERFLRDSYRMNNFNGNDDDDFDHFSNFDDFMVNNGHNNNDNDSPKSNYLWSIPITYRHLNDNNVEKFLMNTKFAYKNNIMRDKNDLIKFNVDHNGLFIVNYPLKQWNKWIELLNNANDTFELSKLSILDRNNLILDSFYLARNGRLSYVKCLQLIEYLKHETSYVVWSIASEMLKYLRIFMNDNDNIKVFDDWFVDNAILNHYNSINWTEYCVETVFDDRSMNDHLFRSLIFNLACDYGHKDCLAEASKCFEKYRQNPNHINKNLLTIILYYGSGNDIESFEYLSENYQNSTTINEKLIFLKSMTKIKNRTIINELLEKSLDSNYLRRQDFFTFLYYLIQSHSNNGEIFDSIWNFYKSNYGQIQTIFGLDDSNVGRMIYRFAYYFQTEHNLNDVKNLFEKYPISGASKLYNKQSLQLIESNLKWRKYYYRTVIEYVTKKCPSKKCPWKQYRLNPSLIPLNYDLRIQINTDNNEFNGTVDIDIQNMDNNTVEYIILHAADKLNVSIDNIIDIDNNTSNVEFQKGFKYSPYEFFIIPLKNALNENSTYKLHMKFNGNLLNNGQIGVYHGSYHHNNDSKTVNIAATQFQSTYARRMFPCFDEPIFKSEIQITIIHLKKMNTTLSNMNLISENSIKMNNDDNEWIESKFARTPPMVTYLIAILISDFYCSSLKSDDIQINVCSSNNYQPKHHRYALEMTPEILKYFKNYTGIKYPLKKLDQIALPTYSMSFNAMENYGLITYRQRKLMWSSDDNLSEEKKDVALIISHEIAHQWFGNIVTMNWWNDLWLNEAFATFMEFKAIDLIKPEYEIWNTFVQQQTYQAIVGDYEQQSQSLIHNVDTPKDIIYYKSRITYNKGATILNMIQNIMGEDKFQKSIQSYLNKYQQKTVTSNELFEELKSNWPQDHIQYYDRFIDSWFKQIGFPYVNIECQANKCNYTQERFIRNGEKSKDSYTYVIPLQYYTQNNNSNELKQSSLIFLNEKFGEFTIEDDDDVNNIVKFNPKFNGFYFVNYRNQKYWNKLIDKMIKNENNFIDQLSVNDRTELLITTYFLSRSNLLEYFQPLKLYNYLYHEKNYVPWSIFEKLIANLAWEIDRTEYRQSYLQFVKRISRIHYDENLWSSPDNSNNESTLSLNERIFNRLIINILCNSNYRKCLIDSYRLFSQWKQNNSQICPDLFLPTISFGLRYSENPEDYDYVWHRFLSSPRKSSNRNDYIEALSYISNEKRLKHYLNLALNETIVSKNEYLKLFISILQHYDHRLMMWNYFRDNYDMLIKKLSIDQMDLLLIKFSEHIITDEQRTSLWNFFKQKQFAGISKLASETIFSRINYNINWLRFNKTKVGEWFGRNGCGGHSSLPEECPWIKSRLNGSVIRPINYDMTIQVDLDTNIYNGSVDIQIQALKSFEFIVLHASKMLNVELISIQNGTNDEELYDKDSVSMFRYEPLEYLVIQFETQQLMATGDYRLKFAFNASLLDAGISGLYLSNYTTSTSMNNSSKLASTQFQFSDARKVFPCFDEPQFKSTFNVRLVHDRKMTKVLSNMEIIGQTNRSSNGNNGQLIETRFNQTLKMPTYLLAMVVSDFECRTNNQTDYDLAVCASSLQQHKLNYALTQAPKCVEHLQKKLGQRFPINKIDLIAIPDFLYGAMENWFLITFRESALLFDEQDTTSERRMAIMNTIAHEFAHFYFGNLVTCKDWNYLVLNEGFARYMQYTILEYVENDWNISDLFLIQDYRSAIDADSKNDQNHPLIRDIKFIEQIDQFDSSIIYSKGASILRMIESIIGMDKFYAAINSYLDANEYQNVEPQQLFQEFDRQFNFTIIDHGDNNQNISMSEFLYEYFYKNGIPYINVNKLSQNEFELIQNRFLLQSNDENSQNNDKIQNETLWKIPITYRNNGTDDHVTQLMVNKSMKLIINGNNNADDQPLNLNKLHQGYYLVNYPLEIWKQWIDYLRNNSKEIHTLDRSGLLMDSFYLAHANLLPYTIPLNLVGFLSNETKDLSSWTLAIDNFKSIFKYLKNNAILYEKFREFSRQLIKSIYNELQWNDNVEESIVRRRLRSLILNYACFIELQDCIDKSKEEFKKWLRNDKEFRMKPNLFDTLIEYGFKHSNTKDNWLLIWSKYANETSSTLRASYMKALLQTNDENLLTMLLENVLNANNNNFIRSQDSYSILTQLINGNNDNNAKILWKFTRRNFKQFLDKNHSPLRLNQVVSMLNKLSEQHFFTREQRSEMMEFFNEYSLLNDRKNNNDNDNDGLMITKKQCLNILKKIDRNIEWLSKRMIEIEEFFHCNLEHLNECPIRKFRLNRSIQPKHYDLDLNVDLSDRKFNGNVSIQIELQPNQTAYHYLYLHSSKSLQIVNVELFDADNQNTLIDIEKTFKYEPFELFIIELAQPIQIDLDKVKNILLRLEFAGELNYEMNGLYLSEYNSKRLASTQFQDIYARKVFPCFDEPTFKSTFQLTIEYPTGYNVISNTMPLNNTEIDDTTRTIFEKTPPMPTYLLAFVISDFQCANNTDPNGIDIYACTTDYQLDMTEYALNKTPSIINEFETEFKQPYQLKKMHLIALPKLSPSAMENLGAITFRDTSLLWESSLSRASEKMKILSVVAHEIAHMWFGNLVTCEWWTDLWLNEAFASYLEWFAVDKVEPNWNYLQLFYVTDQIAGMDADSRSNAHALARKSIEKPNEIAYISHIIYQKGSSILRMFENVLSTQKFYGKIVDYLEKYKDATVTTNNFIDEMKSIQIGDNNVSLTENFLKSWISQPGFPYLNIVKNNDDNNSYIIEQRQFFSDRKLMNNSDNKTWIIPLTYYEDYSENSRSKMIMITDKNTTISMEINQNTTEYPVKFNTDSLGFYIVNYPPNDWQKWTEIFEKNETELRKLSLTEQDYSNILYDSYRLANVKLQSFENVMQLLKIMKQNPKLSIWLTGAKIFDKLWPYFRDNTIDNNGDKNSQSNHIEILFTNYASYIVHNLYRKYNLNQIIFSNKNDDDDQNDQSIIEQRLHSSISSFACKYKFEICTNDAEYLFKNIKLSYYDDRIISPNLLSTILTYGLQNSIDIDDWQFLWNQYTLVPIISLRKSYLRALSHTTNTEALSRLLSYCLEGNPNITDKDDIVDIFVQMSQTSSGFNFSWKFFKQNFNEFHRKLSRKQMEKIVENFSIYMNTNEQLEEFQTFFNKQLLNDNDNSTKVININNALQMIRINIEWIRDYRPTIIDWLQKPRPIS